jgi:hypothetical protein
MRSNPKRPPVPSQGNSSRTANGGGPVRPTGVLRGTTTSAATWQPGLVVARAILTVGSRGETSRLGCFPVDLTPPAAPGAARWRGRPANCDARRGRFAVNHAQGRPDLPQARGVATDPASHDRFGRACRTPDRSDSRTDPGHRRHRCTQPRPTDEIAWWHAPPTSPDRPVSSVALAGWSVPYPRMPLTCWEIGSPIQVGACRPSRVEHLAPGVWTGSLRPPGARAIRAAVAGPWW